MIIKGNDKLSKRLFEQDQFFVLDNQSDVMLWCDSLPPQDECFCWCVRDYIVDIKEQLPLYQQYIGKQCDHIMLCNVQNKLTNQPHSLVVDIVRQVHCFDNSELAAQYIVELYNQRIESIIQQ